MARQRLGVVLLVPQPLATQIDGVRRALGDGALGRIAAHLTLVPPINVHDRDLSSVFATLRAAAAATPPLHLQLGPVATFAPVNPVAYLRVGGEPDHVKALMALREAVGSAALNRPDHHEFVPHVTVADDLSSTRLEAAAVALAAFSADVSFDRVHVLAEQPGRIWVPIADAPLGERAGVAGRGTMPLEMAVSGRPDLEAASLLAVDSEPVGTPFAITVRSEGSVVAAAWGWTAGGRLEVADLVVAATHRGQGIGRHVVAAVEALASRRDCARAGIAAPNAGAPASLLRGCGWKLVAEETPASTSRPRWERAIAVADDRDPSPS